MSPIIACLLGLLLVLALYAYLIEPRWLRIRHRIVHIPGWDPALDGLRILHLSDLHIRRNPSPVDAHVARAAGIDADVVVITGDFIANPRDLDRAVAVLRRLTARRTVYGILGNHEHCNYGFSIPVIQKWNIKERLDTDVVTRALEGAGILMLRNQRVGIPLRGATITLAGMDDIFNRAGDLDKTLSGLDMLNSTILLCHSPDVLPEAAARDVPLVLSGHTHGGQVRAPILGTFTTGTRFPMEHASGILRRGLTTMHVSPGLGLSFPPLRFLVRPEATVLEIRSDGPSSA